MSRNNLTKGSSSSSKDLNNMNPDPISIQIAHQTLEFQDPRTLTFSRLPGSTVNKRTGGKSTINLPTTNANMTLENFFPYVNINSTKSKDGGESQKRSFVEPAQGNNKEGDVKVDKGKKYDEFPQENKENNAAILNKVSKGDFPQMGKGPRAGPMFIKATKAGIELNKNQGEGHIDDKEKDPSSQKIEENKLYNEGGYKENQLTFNPEKREDDIKRSFAGNIDLKEPTNPKKFEFTLGVITPDKKGNNSVSGSQDTKSDWNEQPRKHETTEKQNPRTRAHMPQAGFRVQTEAYDTALEDEMDLMARTFKPIHSRSNRGQREDAISLLQKEADLFKTPKNGGNPQKISKLEEEISNLRSENQRQGKVIEFLIDFVEKAKNPSTKAQPSVIQSLNPNLFLGGRQINYPSQTKLYPENNLPVDSIGGFNEPKKLYMSQSTVKKPNINLYKPTLDLSHEPLVNAGKRATQGDEETPNFNQPHRPYDVSSFANAFSSPTRHNSKLPKVHDPTGQQRVYSSPVPSFIEKNQALPLIAGPRPTKSGNSDNNTRNIIDVRDMHKKTPSSMVEIPDMGMYDPSYSKQTPKTRLGPKQHSMIETDLKRKESSKSTHLLPSLSKGISDNTMDRLDCLEELKYNELKKNIRKESDFPAEPNIENQQFSGANDSKNKGKILKEVFTLNWKKKSCT